ncbi:MAG: TIGR03000 domain-containing protein [Gemmataceae bacterium]
MRLRISLSLMGLTVVTIADVSAQHRHPGRVGVGGVGLGVGVGVTPGWNYHGLAGGPFIGAPFGFGFAPSAYGSQWSNGLSLYGPPVPTFGVTPGAFGGSYQFYHHTPPIFGLGWFGVNTPSPRGNSRLPLLRTPPATTELATPVLESAPLLSAGKTNCLQVQVKLPDAGAKLWVQNQATALSGAERLFESPELVAGTTYQYTFIAKWQQNGAEIAESRVVSGKPGEVVVADFTKPQ